MNHIKSVHEDDKSWCGQVLGIDFYFKTLDQAALAGFFNEQHIIPCAECINECVACLSKHQKEIYE